MTVQELKKRWEEGRSPLVLDVREPMELRIARFPLPTIDIPLRALPARFAELPRDKEIICACHHGGRSAQAAAFLRAAGYRAENLDGGIDAWSRIDPSVPQY